MADISKVKLPDNSVYDINDATARSGLSDKMDKTNPTGTGALSINRKANTTVGANSVAIGDTCEANADQSYAEGAFTKASNGGAHAEGISTVASGGSAHAEGTSTTASGQAAHAEGYHTTASNSSSHAEGYYTTASGAYGSHAEGNHTTAKNKAQHVFGEYNVADPSTAGATSRGTYVEIVGNGTSTTPSNARTLDWQGNETLAGGLKVNGTKDVATQEDITYEKTVSGSIATFTDGGNNIPCKSVKAQIVATQAGSGTPSPSNVRAISGFSTCNLVHYDENLFSTMQSLTKDGITTEYDSNTGLISITNNSRTTNYSSGSERSLVVSGLNISHSYKYMFFPNVVGVVLSNPLTAQLLTETFTGIASVDLRITNQYDFVNTHPIGDITTVRLFIFDITDGYATTHTITLPETIYGGELECVGGSGKKTWECVDLGDLTWNYLSSYQVFSATLLYKKIGRTNIISSNYKVVDKDYTDLDNYEIAALDNSNVVRVKNTNYTDSTTFKTAMAGQKLVYERATPTTFTTTPESIPTLSGVNNIYADCGDVEVTYFTNNADEISDMLAPKADSKDLASLRITGTKNNTGSTISTGTFFYLNDVLVVAKADISNNATLTENTNYTVVTAGVLNSLGLLQTVTPSGSDKLLIVQSQGQGLATLDNVVGVKMDKANPTGTGSLSLNRTGTTGDYSVAVGESCTASGSRSMAEGEHTTTSGRAAHAENYYTTASGNRSHAEGTATIATARSQHVFGEYNVADSNTPTARGSYVEIVGKGTADNARSNARTLDWSGNEVLAGGLKINGTTDVGDTLTNLGKLGVFIRVTSGGQAQIECSSKYRVLIINGMFQEIGALCLIISINNGTIEGVKNLFTNGNFSDANLTFSFSGTVLTINCVNNSYFNVYGAGVAQA